MRNKNNFFKTIGLKEMIFASITATPLQFFLMWLFDWQLNWPKNYGYLFRTGITMLIIIPTVLLLIKNKPEE